MNYLPCIGDVDELSNGKFPGSTAREHLGYHSAMASYTSIANGTLGNLTER
jgi:hypothetical protein